MAKMTLSADLASKHGLPGQLGLTRHGTRVFVELDIPKRGDRIGEKLVPGVEALVVGFLKRLVRRSRSAGQDRMVTAGDDYIAAWVHGDDLDHFLISLAALLDGPVTDEDRSGNDSA